MFKLAMQVLLCRHWPMLSVVMECAYIIRAIGQKIRSHLQVTNVFSKLHDIVHSCTACCVAQQPHFLEHLEGLHANKRALDGG